MENKLKNREKLFCIYFCECRDPRRAAMLAGYGALSKRISAKLLARQDILSQIEKLGGMTAATKNEAVSGYRQMAFGSSADAIKLLFSDGEISEQELMELDLYNVSEIKRPKGGGMEIKFFDRLKALEKLAELSGTDETDSALPFYEVLEKSARAIKEGSESE